MSNQKHDLFGYQDYQFVNEFAGAWTPFNQSVMGYVDTLRLFKHFQKKAHVQNPTEHAATCQGIVLSYLENNCSMTSLSTGTYTTGGLKVKSLTASVNYQASHGSTEEGREAILGGKIQAEKIHFDVRPAKMDLSEIIKKIESTEQGNIFILTGYCRGFNQGEPYEANHVFLIANDGVTWKFFEAQRGEVAFKNFAQLEQWLIKEAMDGALQDLTRSRPNFEVRPGVTRHYNFYTLDSYHKDLSIHPADINEQELDSQSGIKPRS